MSIQELADPPSFIARIENGYEKSEHVRKAHPSRCRSGDRGRVRAQCLVRAVRLLIKAAYGTEVG
jgi:hypothetical protein